MYLPCTASNSESKPGDANARKSFRSSFPVIARQYSGIKNLMPGAPTLTGHATLPTTYPAVAPASHSVGDWISSAYQYQPPRFVRSGSKVMFKAIPCLDG